MATSWVAGNRYLNEAEMKNNAEMFYLRMSAYGFSLNAICGILGNAQFESTINPGIWESLDPFEGGYGLLQWTPYTNYSEWAGANWQDNGDLECDRISYEFANGLQYYPTDSYPLTANQFKVSTLPADQLAEIFLYNYERPGDPSSSITFRRQYALEWYTYLSTTLAFKPRLTMGDIYTSPYYTTWDAYYPGNQMPNCTAYAFGRWNELTDTREYHTRFPIHQAATWYDEGIAKGFKGGKVPQLGAVACWWYMGWDDGEYVPTGHVGVVEEINYDSNGNPISFVTSNSAWFRGTDWDSPRPEHPWFYLNTISMSNLDDPWGSHPEGYFKGFLYNQNIVPNPPLPPFRTGRKMPFIFYLKHKN